jgi:cell division protein FtsA
MGAKSIYGVGLDAGSRRTRLVIFLLEGDEVRFLGYGASDSYGWVKGRIADQGAAAESMLAALREAEATAGASVESAVVGMGGPTMRGANARGVLELGYVREIEQYHVNRVVDRATRVQLQEDRMVVQMFPQDFVVDDHPGHRDPRKMLASRLEMNVHLLTASVQEHNALIGAVNQAHLTVEETVFEALAGAYAAVLPESRREGVAVIDIGAESSELAVYYGDAMQLCSAVRICGDHFTRDLAQGLCIGFDEAEMVKMEYGGAAPEDCADNVMVELPAAGNRQSRDAQMKFVNEILAARAGELFHHVRNELARVGMDRALIGGAFLTGAAARLPGMCDVAERALGCHARFGLVLGVDGWPEELDDPEWTAAAGLAMYSAKLKLQAERQRESTSWLGKILR